MARKLKNLDVKFISLVDRPANRKPIIYKSEDDGRARFELEVKVIEKDEKEGLVFGVVYEPGVIDSQGDWTDQGEIVKAAHRFLSSGRVQMVDLQHNYVPGAGAVVESFIKNGNDQRFPNTKDGAWCVAIKVSDAMKPMMKDIGGLSLAGDATTIEEDPSEMSKSDAASLARIPGAKARIAKARVHTDDNSSA
jgi:hypothetical protein